MFHLTLNVSVWTSFVSKQDEGGQPPDVYIQLTNPFHVDFDQAKFHDSLGGRRRSKTSFEIMAGDQDGVYFFKLGLNRC